MKTLLWLAISLFPAYCLAQTYGINPETGLVSFTGTFNTASSDNVLILCKEFVNNREDIKIISENSRAQELSIYGVGGLIIPFKRSAYRPLQFHLILKKDAANWTYKFTKIRYSKEKYRSDNSNAEYFFIKKGTKKGMESKHVPFYKKATHEYFNTLIKELEEYLE